VTINRSSRQYLKQGLRRICASVRSKLFKADLISSIKGLTTGETIVIDINGQRISARITASGATTILVADDPTIAIIIDQSQHYARIMS